MSRLTTIIIAVVVCIIVSLGWAINRYRDSTTKYKEQRDEEIQALNLANTVITDMTTQQRNVTVLDAKYTKELADMKKQLDDLQRRVRDGKCGLRTNAECPANGAAGAGGMGDTSDP